MAPLQTTHLQFVKHVTPMLEQLFALQENGIRLDLLMAMPPKTINFANDTDCDAGEMPEGDFNTHITRTPIGDDVSYPHEFRVSEVDVKVCINVTCDGGTLGAAAGPNVLVFVPSRTRSWIT